MPPRAPDIVTTPRLLLARFEPADAAAFAALNADPEVMRHIGDGTVLDRAASDHMLARIDADWEAQGHGLWAVRAYGDATLLGFAGLAVPAFLPQVLPAVEVGWRLRRDAWGRGYATEAARAALEVAFDGDGLALASVLAIVAPGNRRSIAVTQRLGMVRGRDRTQPRRRARLRVYELDASSWSRGSGSGTAG